MSSNNAAAPYYFVPGPSKWPMFAGISLLVTMTGASAWVNDASWGMLVCLAGIAMTLAVLYCWFGDAISESVCDLRPAPADQVEQERGARIAAGIEGMSESRDRFAAPQPRRHRRFGAASLARFAQQPLGALAGAAVLGSLQRRQAGRHHRIRR